MSEEDRFVLRGVTVFDGETTLDGPRDVEIDDGVIVSLRSSSEPATSFAHPGIVDAHVHLSFSTADAVWRAGVAAVLDLGAPLDVAFDAGGLGHLEYRAAGPLLTAPGGYPTRSWGADGFGLELALPGDADGVVAMLAGRGAAMIKVAAQGDPVLDVATIRAVADAARGRGLQCVAHALTVESVERCLDAGVDALAHTPVEPLPGRVAAACGERGMTVVSTVRAFGDADSTRANLRALAGAGCRIVYGTDLGNEGIEPGVDPAELRILAEVLGREGALRAATAGAAAFAGFPPARIAEGAPATLTVAASEEFDSLRSPMAVFVDGRRAR